ncbi:MAG TPA: flagellar hook basal-body protein [Vulgatibacter sp.]|nr:flagellar hook basal-body protein [Vulgatibacter sp.]
MADGIYIGMSGAVARMRQLDSIADNLANAQTPGFKASKPAFETYLPKGGTGEKTFVGLVGTGLRLHEGAPVQTGNPLDVFIQGEDFLAVRVGPGQVAYTRDGRLTVSGDGVLHAAGYPLLDDGGAPLIAPPEETVTIDDRGVVRANQLEIGRIGFHRIVGPLTRLGGALMAPTENAVAVPVAGSLRVGELELANTTPLEAMVEMIGVQRGFDHSMQAIQTYRKLDERAAEIGRVR